MISMGCGEVKKTYCKFVNRCLYNFFFALVLLKPHWKRLTSSWTLTIGLRALTPHTDSTQPVAIDADLIQSNKMRFVVQSSISWKMSVVLRVYVRQYNWFELNVERTKKRTNGLNLMSLLLTLTLFLWKERRRDFL